MTETVTFNSGQTGPDAPAADTGAAAPTRPEGLPENFDSVEALVTSYKEAQAKLTKTGQQDTSDDATPPEAPETEDQTNQEPSALPENLASFSEEFSKDGKLGDESYTKLAELGYSKDVVDAYIRGVTGTASEAITAEEVTAIKTSVGGEEKFTALQTWAGENLTDAELASYNNGIANKATAQMSVDWLQGRMQAVEGFEPATVVTGNNASGSEVKGYSSTAELSRAMGDPLYKAGDKAYHAQVEARLAKTTAF